MKRLILILLTLFIFTNCEKENEDPKPNNNNPNPKDKQDQKQDLPALSVIDIQNESDDWDYFAISDSSDYFLYNIEDNKPREFFYHSNEEELAIFFDETGLPRKLVSGNFVILFENFEGNEVDMGIKYPDGTIEILREVESEEINWDNFTNGRTARTSDWKDVLKWTARIAKGIPCYTSIASTISTGGFTWPLILQKCLPYAINLATDIAEEKGIESGFLDFVEKYEILSLAVDCADLSAACFEGLAEEAYDRLLDYAAELLEPVIEDLEKELRNPNTPPDAHFVIPNGATGTTQKEFIFDASGSYDAEDEFNLLYRWDFETDGNFDTEFSSSNRTTHKFSSPGLYEVTLEVKDSGDSTDTSWGFVKVEEEIREDEEKILLSLGKGFDGYSVKKRDIYLLNPDGTGLESITFNEERVFDTNPSWSPNGKEIYFIRRNKDYNKGIYSFDMKNYFETNLVPYGEEDIQNIFCSNDGTKLLLYYQSSSSEEKDYSLWIFQFGNHNFLELTSSGKINEYNPCWSPDDLYIVFDGSPKEAPFERHVYKKYIFGEPTKLIQEKSYGPRWSPDGTKIAFVSGEDIYIVNSDGTTKQKITNNEHGTNVGIPSWSPSGKKLAYVIYVSTETSWTEELWIIDSNGSNNHKIFEDPRIGNPDWGKISYQ